MWSPHFWSTKLLALPLSWHPGQGHMVTTNTQRESPGPVSSSSEGSLPLCGGHTSFSCPLTHGSRGLLTCACLVMLGVRKWPHSAAGTRPVAWAQPLHPTVPRSVCWRGGVRPLSTFLGSQDFPRTLCSRCPNRSCLLLCRQRVVGAVTVRGRCVGEDRPQEAGGAPRDTPRPSLWGDGARC